MFMEKIYFICEKYRIKIIVNQSLLHFIQQMISFGF